MKKIILGMLVIVLSVIVIGATYAPYDIEGFNEPRERASMQSLFSTTVGHTHDGTNSSKVSNNLGVSTKSTTTTSVWTLTTAEAITPVLKPTKFSTTVAAIVAPNVTGKYFIVVNATTDTAVTIGTTTTTGITVATSRTAIVICVDGEYKRVTADSTQ